MALFAREELHRLLAPHPAPCLSLFMPTHRHRPDTEQDPIRFKNLLKTAEKLLAERYTSRDVRDFLEPLAALPDPWFWRYQMDGLALFRSADLAEHYHLPMRLPERVVVAESFHVKPLLRFLQANQHYYVLALSQKAVTLYEGTPFALGPVDLSGLPSSLAEVLGLERPEPFLNLRTMGAGRPPLFHGHGAPEVSKKEDLQRFFRAIDKALWEFLRDDPAPLILAGVGYYFPLYAELSRCPNLTDRGVEGNFDAASAHELHERAWPLAREILRAREDAVLEDYRAAVGRGLTTEDLTVAARMTVHGRVRRLLLAEGAHVWGRLDPETGQLALAGSHERAHLDDALDDLAEGVLGRGGEVLLFPADRMPGPSPVAAALRW